MVVMGAGHGGQREAPQAHPPPGRSLVNMGQEKTTAPVRPGGIRTQKSTSPALSMCGQPSPDPSTRHDNWHQGSCNTCCCPPDPT